MLETLKQQLVPCLLFGLSFFVFGLFIPWLKDDWTVNKTGNKASGRVTKTARLYCIRLYCFGAHDIEKNCILDITFLNFHWLWIRAQITAHLLRLLYCECGFSCGSGKQQSYCIQGWINKLFDTKQLQSKHKLCSRQKPHTKWEYIVRASVKIHLPRSFHLLGFRGKWKIESKGTAWHKPNLFQTPC